MKCLLVFAVALAAVRAEEVKVVEAVKPLTHVQPLTYAYPAPHPFYTPIVYNSHKVVTPVVAPAKEVVHEYQPVQYVAKPEPYDVEVESAKVPVAPVHALPTVYHQPAVYHQPIVYHQP